MRSRKFYVMLLVVILVLLLVGCGSPAQGNLPEGNPGDTVKAFYDWYLGDLSGPPKDARESGFLHPELVQRIDEMMESPVPIDQVSFVCAQDFPNSVEVVSSEIKGDTAEVLVRTSFGGNVRLIMRVDQGEWRIHDVKCE